MILRYPQVVQAHWAPPEGVGSVFKRCLHSAITDGLAPPLTSTLGPRTCHAIQRVADDHPEAGVDLIAGAYDAFAAEHSGMALPTVDVNDVAGRPPAPKSGAQRLKRARVR